MFESSTDFRLIVRRLLIAAVVLGLFFSSGEGIRLMPFPDSATGTERTDSLGANSELPGYSDSVLKFGQSVSIVKSASSRDGFRQILFVSVGDFRESIVKVVLSRDFANGPINRFTAPALTSCRSDRAPPVLS